MKTYTMLDSEEVKQETINGLSIGPMYFDPVDDLELAYFKVIKI